MKFILEEISSYEELKNLANFLFKESEDQVNKFTLIKTEHGKVGITYYFLGIEPSIYINQNILFMAFGTCIITFNILLQNMLYKSTDAMHVVYELIYNPFFDYIICICELSILAFDSKGLIMWESGMHDIITDYRIEGSSIRLQFGDESVLKLSLENGKPITGG